MPPERPCSPSCLAYQQFSRRGERRHPAVGSACGWAPPPPQPGRQLFSRLTTRGLPFPKIRRKEPSPSRGAEEEKGLMPFSSGRAAIHPPTFASKPLYLLIHEEKQARGPGYEKGHSILENLVPHAYTESFTQLR